MTPVVDKLRKENKNVFKINLARQMDMARAFGVMGTPATVLVKNSKIDTYVLGAKTEAYLRGLLP